MLGLKVLVYLGKKEKIRNQESCFVRQTSSASAQLCKKPNTKQPNSKPTQPASRRLRSLLETHASTLRDRHTTHIVDATAYDVVHPSPFTRSHSLPSRTANLRQSTAKKISGLGFARLIPGPHLTAVSQIHTAVQCKS
ncbi:hypothetical protein COCVIDRAFT_15009 [Bipolaris victoriae FI3]|uniref:Uncharacterized protein n=1 Tax=Bipolaris victoriae (strain FI3) TaxID=930091 RepID=W7ECW1_BIPV3|nr:hypothetical protein COCVIDRAFT_15009 [Bipolaris victoriae FI3]